MKKLQILGTGCPRCSKLAEAARTAADELGIDYELATVSDIGDIVDFGVMMMPAVAIDGEVKIAGKVPSVEELKAVFAEGGPA